MSLLVCPQLDTALIAKLEQLAKDMSEARDEWCLIGGAALALWAVDGVSVRDIDVLCSVDDALAFMQKQGIGIPPPSASAKFRSKAYAQIGAGIAFDFMAELEVNTSGGWVRVPPRPEFCMIFGGHPIYLPSREELARILQLFGREKDIKRLQLLERQSPFHPKL